MMGIGYDGFFLVEIAFVVWLTNEHTFFSSISLVKLMHSDSGSERDDSKATEILSNEQCTKSGVSGV